MTRLIKVQNELFTKENFGWFGGLVIDGTTYNFDCVEELLSFIEASACGLNNFDRIIINRMAKMVLGRSLRFKEADVIVGVAANNVSSNATFRILKMASWGPQGNQPTRIYVDAETLEGLCCSYYIDLKSGKRYDTKRCEESISKADCLAREMAVLKVSSEDEVLSFRGTKIA